MIPGPFSYHRPASVEDAVALLAHHGDTARAIAGGHSLIPMMKLRMATPSHLIDLAGIASLREITEGADGITIGARVTQAEIIGSPVLGKALPILRETAEQIADPQIRACGTIGGNVANGDPGNDMPALMQALDAQYLLAGPEGARIVASRAFYRGAFDVDLKPGEMLTGVRIVPPPPGHGFAYEKLKRKVGDYATAATAVVLTMAGGKVTHAAITLTNLASTPLYAEAATALVLGTALGAATIRAAAEAAQSITDPATDGRGTAEYRRAMAGVMTVRALSRAKGRAQGGQG